MDKTKVISLSGSGLEKKKNRVEISRITGTKKQLKPE